MNDVPIPSTKQQKVWKCSHCTQTFRWKRHLDKHTEGHAKNICRLCDASLPTRKQLVVHMADRHQKVVKDEKYKCDYCDKKFEKKTVLYNHYKKNHSCGLEVCMKCGAFLVTSKDEELHKLKHEKERPWKCTRCGESFLRRQQYIVHMQDHDRYICRLCSLSFSTKLKMNVHNQKMHPELNLNPTHKCQTCSQTFLRPGLLKMHLRTHTGEKPIFCQICNKNFRTPTGLNCHLKSSLHRENSTDGESKRFKCDNCGKSFIKKCNLIVHLRHSHSYKCEYCEFTSRSKENTKRHLALHTEGRQFICEQCGLAFFTLAALNDHCKYVHSQVRQFACQQCSQAFKTNSGLNRHLQAHSDVRPYTCHCGQAYKRQSHLRRHQDSTHGPTLRPTKKLQRLCRDETGKLVPIVEEVKFKQKLVKKSDIRKEATKATEIESSPWQGNLVSLMVGNPGQVVTIQQMCDIQHCRVEGDSYETIQVEYDLDFSAPTTSASEQQLVFTTLEPSQQLLENMLKEDMSLKNSDHIYISEERDGNLTTVMLDSNAGHVPMQSCIDDSNPMLASSDDLLQWRLEPF